MAGRTVRQKRRRRERSPGPARLVRTDAPRRAGSLLPRPGLGHADGLSGETDRPRPVSTKRLSRHGPGLRERRSYHLLAREACEVDWDFTEYNVIERLWIYIPLGHAEDLKFQELSIEKFSRWSVDLVADVPPHRRRINQFVGWSIVKAALEHSEALLLFDRFPHRNAIMQRPHRGGEPRYLTNEMRPLWSFTQPPHPDYFALLGALCGMEAGLDETRITREALAGLLLAAGLLPEDPASPMDVFVLAGDDIVSYPFLYRHLRLPEHARTFDTLRNLPQVDDLRDAVKALILRDGDLSWPPQERKALGATRSRCCGTERACPR